MSDDSSSSDERTSRLKEAIDKSLLKDDLYLNGIAKKGGNQSKPPQSLRNQNNETLITNPFSLKVTPEFQKYVSEHLLELLNRTIDDSQILIMKKWRKKNVNGGIKLLHTSKKCLNPVENIEMFGNPRKCKAKINGEKIDYEARAREVAVSSEWVLSKKEVKAWASKWKNNVEIIKLGNCKSKEKEKRFW